MCIMVGEMVLGIPNYALLSLFAVLSYHGPVCSAELTLFAPLPKGPMLAASILVYTFSTVKALKFDV